jgi:hypothetical protein
MFILQKGGNVVKNEQTLHLKLVLLRFLYGAPSFITISS